MGSDFFNDWVQHLEQHLQITKVSAENYYWQFVLPSKDVLSFFNSGWFEHEGLMFSPVQFWVILIQTNPPILSLYLLHVQPQYRFGNLIKLRFIHREALYTYQMFQLRHCRKQVCFSYFRPTTLLQKDETGSERL